MKTPCAAYGAPDSNSSLNLERNVTEFDATEAPLRLGID